MLINHECQTASQIQLVIKSSGRCGVAMLAMCAVFVYIVCGPRSRPRLRDCAGPYIVRAGVQPAGRLTEPESWWPGSRFTRDLAHLKLEYHKYQCGITPILNLNKTLHMSRQLSWHVQNFVVTLTTASCGEI